MERNKKYSIDGKAISHIIMLFVAKLVNFIKKNNKDFMKIHAFRLIQTTIIEKIVVV